jgi:hypothetical protein
MARLTAAQRRALPSSAFVYPAERKYPIPDPAHARAALSRAAVSRNFGSPAKVRAVVNRRFGRKVKLSEAQRR